MITCFRSLAIGLEVNSITGVSRARIAVGNGELKLGSRAACVEEVRQTFGQWQQVSELYRAEKVLQV